VRKVPLLVTLDLHGLDAEAKPRVGIADNVKRSLREFRGMGIKATYFVPASVFEDYPEFVEWILADGHQVASHGYLHNNLGPYRGYPPERYDLLDQDTQRTFFEAANRIFETVMPGQPPTCFRSPCFGISGSTVPLLEEYGFRADLSVCSQRLDFLTSDPYSFKNLAAPRLPYHPDLGNPFKAGDTELWEIPISSFIVPLAVMTLITFGMTLNKAFFRALRRESLSNGKPIVYMCHVEEFCTDGETYTIPWKDLTFKDFLPTKEHGFRARQAFRIGDPAKIFEYNVRYLDFMASMEAVESVTADGYIDGWLEGASEA